MNVDIAQVERRIKNLEDLTIVRMYSVSGSLSEGISASPEWWTPTAKAKAIAGVVLSMRFAHSNGLLHGHHTANNGFFDHDGVIQVCDFF
jgi:hypothetical protein